MHVTFWGTRGSIAKAGPTTLRYGGNTSCVEVRSDAGTLLVLDCGTGAHGLGQDLVRRAEPPTAGHLLISHTHWDHIQGLPFFAPLFDGDSTWDIYGPRGLGATLSETLAGQMQYSYFPVTLEQLAARVRYHDLVEGSFEIDDIHISTHYLNHPALTLGYRIEADGVAVVYASDHEPHDRDLAAGGDIATSLQDRLHAKFFEDADLLIHDTQYLAREYHAKVGWGHSTMEYVIDTAAHAGVRTVVLYHHDPTRDDDAVDEVLELARARATLIGYEGAIVGAAEGLHLELRDATARPRRSSARSDAAQLPALEEVRRVVLICACDPEMSAVIREAAEAEGLQVWETGDCASGETVAGDVEPSIIFFEDDAEGINVATFAQTIREMAPPYGDEVGLIAVSRYGARSDTDDERAVTDWLVWPSTAVHVRTKLRAWLLRRACRWQAAPLPNDERRRLATLEGLDVLDTEPEDRFDRITRLASEQLGVPIALVSLVDRDRQWFKSRHGLDATETPRDMAFCAHAILGDDVLQVPDTLVDARFADNPLVTSAPRVRFYAGAPLVLSDGTRAGTMCVIDHRPRLLDDTQLDQLRRLAELAAHELESGP